VLCKHEVAGSNPVTSTNPVSNFSAAFSRRGGILLMPVVLIRRVTRMFSGLLGAIVRHDSCHFSTR
jgi:hypothetical protein